MPTTEKPQHMQALERANQIRWARAELKRQVRRGEVSAAEVIAPDRPLRQEVESMPAMELLCAQNRWGRERSRKLLVRLAIGERRRLDSLTTRERERLRDALNGAELPDARLLAA